MLPSIGGAEVAVVVGVVALLFGAKRIPELARNLGRSITEFKRGLKGDGGEEKAGSEKNETPPEKKEE